MAVLLLQGPLGSFFKHFSDQLSQAGETVYKINFNGGDEFYAQSDNSIAYTDKPKDWSAFLTRFIELNNIQTVFTYGDCRFYHHEAKRICINHDVRYFAFEEGYLRPNYITLEEGGVNGHSPLANDEGHKAIEAYAPVHAVKDEELISPNFFKRIIYAAVYYNVSALSRLKFLSYKHHRSFNPVFEAFCWNRGFIRKLIYKAVEPDAQEVSDKGRFYLVPLQVYNDAQIEFHSDYENMEAFITEVLESFAKSKQQCNLVIKHHPMDRGHVNYKSFISKLSRKLNIQEQVFYIHDQHLPTLLKNCLGVVTINSTTALQAFYHKAPVTVMGDAFFDMPGLTHQSNLDDFWLKPEVLDEEFADRFRGYLLDHGQINGSFYCDADICFTHLMPYLEKQGVVASAS